MVVLKDEACALTSKYRGKVRMLVGGTDLSVRLKAEQWATEHVIDLKGIGIDWLKAAQNMQEGGRK